MTDKEVRSGEAAIVQKQMEDALRESETVFHAAIEQSLDGITISDEHGNVQTWNKSMTSITGIQERDAIGRPVWEILTRVIPDEQRTPKLLQQLQTGLKSILRSRTGWQWESREQTIICADGSRKVVQGSSFIIRTHDATRFGTIVRDITERKQAQDKLQVAQSQWSQFLEISPDPMWIKDASGRYVAASKSYLHADPSAEGDIIGKTDAECFPPEKAAVYVADDRVAIDTGASESEFTAVGVDGKLRTFLTKKVVLRAPDGSVAGTLGVSRDITERKQMEEKVRMSEFDLRRAQAVAHVGSWRWDIARDELSWSDEMCHIFGIARHAFTGSWWNAIAHAIHPDDQTRVENARKAVIEDHNPQSLEYRIVRSDGSVRTIWDETEEMTLDDKGRVSSLTGIVVDITERKQAEQALRESEERYRTLIQSVGEGIGFVDPEEQFAFANAAAEDIFGVPRGGLLGRSLGEFTKAEQFGMIREQTDQRRAGEKGVYEIEISRPKGEKRNLLITAVPQFDSQGKFVGALGVFRDFTERKRAEEETQRERAFFDQLVETAPEGLAITDTEGEVMRVNAEFVRMFGYGVDEALGRSIDDMVALPGREEEARTITRSVGEGETTLLETVRRRKDGTLVDVSLIVAPCVPHRRTYCDRREAGGGLRHLP